MKEQWNTILVMAICILAFSFNAYAQDKSVVAWKRVVPDSTRLGALKHRYYPAIFKDGVARTHFGVDILGPRGTSQLCGKPIYPLYLGEVIDTKTGYAGGLGNAVLMKHPGRAPDGGDLYTVYLHMQSKPLVSKGWTNGLSPIGFVGMTGFANGVCHTHFEIRKFFHDNSAGGNGWFHEKLSGIYAKGDVRNTEWAKNDWLNPENVFVRQGYRDISEGHISIRWWPSDVPCDKASLWEYNKTCSAEYSNPATCQLVYDELKSINPWKYSGSDWRTIFFGKIYDFQKLCY